MANDQQVDVLEMIREIRNEHYEATKHMTREEKRAYDRKEYEEAKKAMANVDPSTCNYDFSWLWPNTNQAVIK